MYLIIDSSDINSDFSIQLQNEWRAIWAEKKKFDFFLVKTKQNAFLTKNHNFLKFPPNSILTLRNKGLLKKK